MCTKPLMQRREPFTASSFYSRPWSQITPPRLVVVIDSVHQIEDQALAWLPGKRTHFMQWLPTTSSTLPDSIRSDNLPPAFRLLALAPCKTIDGQRVCFNVRFIVSASPGASHTALTAMGCNRLCIHPLSDDDRRGLISKTMKEASKHLTVCLALDFIALLNFSEVFLESVL